MDDWEFGSDLDAPPSLSHLEQWLSGEFGGEKSTDVAEEPPICPSLVSATSSKAPAPPSACPSVPAGLNPISSRGSTSECEVHEKKINIEYVFWTPELKDKPPPTRSTYKRKAPPTPEDTKYIKLRSEKGKIDILWDIENLSLADFKSYIFQAIREQDAPELGDNAEQLDENGMITWEVAVPHGGPFAAKNKPAIDNDEVFAEFIEVISTPGEQGRKVVVTLIEKDPNALAQKNKALKHLKKKHDAPADDHHPPVPSVGGALSAEIVANIRKIRAQNPPCERLTGNHEIPVFINPKNNNEFFRITVDRVTLWAMAMTKNKDITPSNPPKSPAFSFETCAQPPPSDQGVPMPSPAVPSSPQAPQTSVATPSRIGQTTTASHQTPQLVGYGTPSGQIVYVPYQPPVPAPFQYMPGYGQPGAPPMPTSSPAIYPGGMFPGLGYPMNVQGSSQTPNVATPQAGGAPSGVPSSPAPSDEVDLDEYLLFAHVNPADFVIQRALDNLGITHYSSFRNFDATELEEAGIKKGHARSLIGSLGRFERHLKTRQSHGQ